MPPLHQYVAHASHSQQDTVDVDAATYQLAGTRLEGGEVSAVAAASAAMRRQNQSPTYDNSNIMRTDSRDMDVGSTTLSFSGSGTDSVVLATGKEQMQHQQQQLPRPNQPENQDLEDGKDAKKVRADHVDNFLNGQPASFSFPANGQMFDAFQLANGKIPPSISQSFSFIMKGGPSRESSMEFRKNTLNGGNRDMSIDFLKRDFSMELVNQVRKSSGDQVSSELPRDMSVDFLGRALSQANRDFSMEMQFPQNQSHMQRGTGIELGVFGEYEGEGQLSFLHNGQSREDLNREFVSAGSTGQHGEQSRPGSVMRSKIGQSQDDLMIHTLGNQANLPNRRRGINGSIEDFREVLHPF